MVDFPYQKYISKSAQIEFRFERFCLLAAPVLLAVATFFWENGEYGAIAAPLTVIALFLWIPAFSVLFAPLKIKMPYYATWGRWVAVFGCISGIGFAFLGYLATVLGISHAQYISALSKYPVSSQILFFGSGPLFPLSLLLLTLMLLLNRLIGISTALIMFFATISFPLSRISRWEWLAHISDLLLIMACFLMATRSFEKKKI